MRYKTVEKENGNVYFRYINEMRKLLSRGREVVRILIIADDETGMLDTGAQFARRGIRTEAIIQKPSAEFFRQSEAVVAVINTGTRHASKEEAYRKVYEISEIALKAGVPVLYKKTDSALRGPVGAELKALMDAADENLYFFPAYPDAGRTTVKGVQYAGGIPVGESVFAKDELNPMTESYIPYILRQSADVAVELAGEAESREPGKRQITVFDGESAEAFHRTVEAFLAKQTPKLLAGCAGLAHELADIWRLPTGEPQEFPAIEKMFVLCGSSNPVTREQMDHAAGHGVTRFTLKKEDMSGREQLPAVRKACIEGKSIILDMEYLVPEMTANPGITRQELGKLIVESVNRILIQCMDVLEDYILFLTGGDTLERFIELSECERIQILGEFSPGIVKNLFYIKGRKVYAISKSGGFGDREILLQLLEEKGGKKNEGES